MNEYTIQRKVNQNTAHIRELLSECAYTYDGLDSALIGVTDNGYAVYEKNLIIEELMREGMTEEEALDSYYFNILGMHIGVSQPIIVDLLWWGENSIVIKKKKKVSKSKKISKPIEKDIPSDNPVNYLEL